jgi:hypothetical protein
MPSTARGAAIERPADGQKGAPREAFPPEACLHSRSVHPSRVSDAAHGRVGLPPLQFADDLPEQVFQRDDAEGVAFVIRGDRRAPRRPGRGSP